MRTPAIRFLIACLLAASAFACVAEFTGRWDRTLRDANDEAGIAVVALCVGAALAVAGAVADAVRLPAHAIRFRPLLSSEPLQIATAAAVPRCSGSPPDTLRI